MVKRGKREKSQRVSNDETFGVRGSNASCEKTTHRDLSSSIESNLGHGRRARCLSLNARQSSFKAPIDVDTRCDASIETTDGFTRPRDEATIDASDGFKLTVTMFILYYSVVENRFTDNARLAKVSTFRSRLLASTNRIIIYTNFYQYPIPVGEQNS